MYRVMTGKYKCHMACSSYKIHDVEKMFWGIQKYMCCKNLFFDHINEIHPHWGKRVHLLCHITLPNINGNHTQTKK